MHVIRRRGWEIPASLTTPEAAFVDRRAFLAGLSAAGIYVSWPGRASADDADPSAALYPAQRNPAYVLDRDVTPEKYNLTYNNFYEFSTNKRLDASALKTRPWMVKLDGLVEKEQTVDIDTLIKTMGLEERLYRHRCVEAWSMAIPWTGFPLKKLVAFAKPLSSASYVRFETFLDKKMAPGQRSFMPWPYVEGLTMAEATNDLAFIATGAYGKPLAKVQGAPIRLATPWKYGFKSAKSIVKISFVTSGRRRSGRRSDLTNTASGPTSIRRCRTRDGARRKRLFSTTASCAQRRSTTATASRWPRCTRASTKRRSTSEGV